ncbi:unnamed protein product [Linum trigynum]|uniref:Uncharacterized protein n=1 Tax=Linum trigynum TaxID=586398 RepID=A0AAV2ECT8_9ROSI
MPLCPWCGFAHKDHSVILSSLSKGVFPPSYREVCEPVGRKFYDNDSLGRSEIGLSPSWKKHSREGSITRRRNILVVGVLPRGRIILVVFWLIRYVLVLAVLGSSLVLRLSGKRLSVLVITQRCIAQRREAFPRGSIARRHFLSLAKRRKA